MRVLMTADTVGGVWTYSLQLARSLAHFGVTIDLATMGAPLTEKQHAEAAGLPNLYIHESLYKLEWMAAPWEEVDAAGEWLLSLERELEPEVVQLNGYAQGALPWRAPLLVVGHSCVLSWWDAVKGEPVPPDFDEYRRRVAEGLHAADIVVAPSAAMLKSLEQHYGRLPGGRVIYNGQDETLFRPANKEPFVLSVGRLWDEGKNIAALQQIAGMLPWPVLVAGEERHPEGGDVQLGGLQALGRLSQIELAGYYARAAIYALPARYEPFGLSVLEAAFSGCALVLGDIPTLREIWGEAALFVPPGDAGVLQQAIEGLIADRSWRQGLAERARHRAGMFSVGRQADAYFALYSELSKQAGVSVP